MYIAQVHQYTFEHIVYFQEHPIDLVWKQ